MLQIQEWWKIRQHPTLLCCGALIPRVTQLNLRCQDIESVTLQSHAVLPCKVLSFFFFFIKACYREVNSSSPCHVALKDNGASGSEIL